VIWESIVKIVKEEGAELELYAWLKPMTMLM